MSSTTRQGIFFFCRLTRYCCRTPSWREIILSSAELVLAIWTCRRSGRATLGPPLILFWGKPGNVLTRTCQWHAPGNVTVAAGFLAFSRHRFFLSSRWTLVTKTTTRSACLYVYSFIVILKLPIVFYTLILVSNTAAVCTVTKRAPFDTVNSFFAILTTSSVSALQYLFDRDALFIDSAMDSLVAARASFSSSARFGCHVDFSVLSFFIRYNTLE